MCCLLTARKILVKADDGNSHRDSGTKSIRCTVIVIPESHSFIAMMNHGIRSATSPQTVRMILGKIESYRMWIFAGRQNVLRESMEDSIVPDSLGGLSFLRYLLGSCAELRRPSSRTRPRNSSQVLDHSKLFQLFRFSNGHLHQTLLAILNWKDKFAVIR